MNKVILIVDDDLKLCKLLGKFLESRGFFPMYSYNGSEALETLKKSKPDIVLLDVMMPGDNGFDVLKKIRKISNIPVIMLTARGEVSDKIVGLELGADDYVPKPFEPVEIEARIHAILRRTNSQEVSDITRFSDFSFDLKRQLLTRLGELEETIDLTHAEYSLLEYFIKNSNQIVSRGQITEYLRGDDFDPFQRNIDILVSRLRKKLSDDPKKPSLIKTIHGRGYMFFLK
jgi:DNA-binding response OmpR family regulator